jgi:hypothetical protein
MPPSPNQQLREATAEVVQGILNRGPYPSSVLPDGRNVQVRWGTPGGYLAASGLVCVALNQEWLGTIHEQGLSSVDGYLVLDAQPTSSANLPSECEGAWIAKVLVPQGWREMVGFIVQFGGVTKWGQTSKDALQRCHTQWLLDMGVVE